ncbi:MAG: hypothetical protein LBI71_10140 [Enterobacteriaceae bacterium]|jgi:Mn-dependent DtxR family transcriptional regulator|nr:hypothetical protein [Enterobacteriaceae bacterium]
MKALASKVLIEQYCYGLNEIQFPAGITRLDGRLAEILSVSQWSVSELAQYLHDMDMVDSVIEELNKIKQEAA